MGRLQWGLLGGAALAVAVPVFLATTDRPTVAADHLDSPTRTDPAFDMTPDRPADIADVYTWYTASSVIIAMTFAGPAPADNPGTYDREVLYTINISTDADKATVEIPINIRFGQAGNLNGVQFNGLPGLTDPFVGPVETDLTTSNGIKLRAGLFDDPFFFDLQGFRETRSTGTLKFDKNRNFFNGQNDTAIVMEIPRTLLANGTNPLAIWGATSRLGGNL